jgi:hypothetical protein
MERLTTEMTDATQAEMEKTRDEYQQAFTALKGAQHELQVRERGYK